MTIFLLFLMILFIACIAASVDFDLEKRIEKLEKRLSDYETKDQQKYQ